MVNTRFKRKSSSDFSAVNVELLDGTQLSIDFYDTDEKAQEVSSALVKAIWGDSPPV